MNIALDGQSLSFMGGMERSVCALASAMAERGHKVFLFTSDAPSTTPIFYLSPKVCRLSYDHNGRRSHMARFRQQILSCTPQVCISFAGDRRHLPWCAALQGTGIPFIISEQCSPEAVETIFWNRPERLAVMAVADYIHMLRPTCLDSLPPESRAKAHVIPNAVSMPDYSLAHKKGDLIVALGRLEKDKQYGMLVEAFALLTHDFPSWKLEIWGEGSQYASLRRSIVQAKLEDRVRLCGLTEHPERCYARASIVCHPSRHEGLPGVVLEAMAAGLPVVGFAQCPGVNDLVQDGQIGLLAPEMTPQSLAATLRQLMSNAHLRQYMGAEALERAKVYSADTVYTQWEKLLTKAAAKGGHTCLQAWETALSAANTDDNGALFPHYQTLQTSLNRPNLLVPRGQLLKLLIFQFPWLMRLVRPFYTWCKNLRSL